MQAEHSLVDDEELTWGFSRRRDSAIQRSQDSGALTDWSGSRGSPTRESCDSLERELEPAKYVTVLSVNGGLDLHRDPSDYVTVVSIGRADDENAEGSSVCLSLAGFIEEVVRIPRKPGQKLGFGLKFDGGVEPETLVRRLFIQCCADSSPASGVRCSWGKLVEADEIIEIDGVDIRNSLGRVQVVHKLTDGQEVLTLKIRHYWDERQRNEIMDQLGTGHRAETKSTRKSPAVRHERAVDVPDELLHQLNHSRSRSLEPHRDGLPPPVPPPRRRKSKADKVPVARSLSSDQVLGQRSIVNIPSKPPRRGLQQSLSFNEKSSEMAPSTLPRTIIPPEPAKVYINLIAEEDKRNEVCIESESDTSLSTVVSANSINTSPFCETIEIPEFREQSKPLIQKEPTAINDTEMANDSALAVLIQPPETFLDREPSSISPNSDGHQDASSDSGASSGGSELQLTESDEELRFFQQMESALESGEDCDAILWPLPEASCPSSEEEKEPIDGVERQECQEETASSVKHEAGKQVEAVKVEQKKANVNRSKSRIPQAVSSSRVMPAQAASKSPAGAGVNSRVGRALANNKTTSGNTSATTVKSVKSPAVRNNAPANRVAAARSTSNLPQAKPTLANSNNKAPATATTTLLKSVKPGLGAQQQQQQQQQQQSKIPRAAQVKSGPAAQLTRPAVRHPSSSPMRTGVKAAVGAAYQQHQQQLKSPSRPHLTHANKVDGGPETSRAEAGARAREMAATACTGTYATSPPSSRLPPDGHEFPGDYLDDSSSSTSSSSSSSSSSHAKLTATPAAGAAGGRTTSAGLWRSGSQSASANGSGRDERSERSVRDKIALFTKDTKTPAALARPTHLSPIKVKYTPPLSCSVDNLTVGRRSPMISPVARGSDARTRLLALSTASAGSASASASAASAAGTSETVNLSERSRSLLDVASNNRINPSNSSSARKASFEVRRKSSLSSKLRGLVIPDESRTELLTNHRAVIDLPEIISKDSVLVVGIAPLTPPLRSPTGSQNSNHSSLVDETDHANKASASVLGSLPWKSASPSVPKYSPAFKRKELTVARSSSCYQGVHHHHQQHQDEEAPPPPPPPPSTKPPPPPLSTATITTTTTTKTVYSSSSDVEALFNRSHAGTGVDEKEANNSDTDGDSAVSSSRSSFSPANSPVPDRRAQQHIDAGRVLKAHSVEALNRKNVLQSARFSSGGSVVALDATPPPPLPSPPISFAPGKSGDTMRTLQRKSGDFEQTLKKFTSAEAQGRIERTAPPRTRLSSSERLEIKTAMITDVCSEPSPSTTTSPAIIKQAPPPPPPHHDAPAKSNKSSPSTPTYDYRSSPIMSPSKEIKSFRALAERWEAISTSDAASSPPSHHINNANNNNNNNNSSVVNSNTTINNSKKTEKEVVKTVSSFTPGGSSRPVTTRSVTAGVVEIRKAFERVKEELETESSSHCALDGQNEDYPSYRQQQQQQQQHSIFTLQHQSSSSSLGHARMSSLDSTNSGDDNSLPFGFGGGNMFANYANYAGFGGPFGGYGGPFGIGVRDNYGSITSLASSTSLISPQELQQLLDEANQSLEESGTPSHEIVVVVLHRGDVASSLTAGLGITLAGGADYETKEITIHKVIGGSVADRDGRIQKGDRVLSINGKGLKGVTHREALAILKAPRPEVVLVLSRNRSVSPQDIGGEPDKDLPANMVQASNTGLVSSGSSGSSHSSSRTSHYILPGHSGRPPRILESPSDFGNSYDPAGEAEAVNRGPPIQTTLFKDGAGLGFSLEGGKDSPLGDRPLTIKKIFTGGAASKNGTLRVGDQIISVNACDVTSMSRIEAWNLMKKLADGAVSLVIRQQLSSAS